jgi:hypothetical protein
VNGAQDRLQAEELRLKPLLPRINGRLLHPSDFFEGFFDAGCIIMDENMRISRTGGR